jgi:hypothetical protein
LSDVFICVQQFVSFAEPKHRHLGNFSLLLAGRFFKAVKETANDERSFSELRLVVVSCEFHFYHLYLVSLVVDCSAEGKPFLFRKPYPSQYERLPSDYSGVNLLCLRSSCDLLKLGGGTVEDHSDGGAAVVAALRLHDLNL